MIERVYFSLPYLFDSDSPVTIEAKADEDGRLNNRIQDEDLRFQLDKIVGTKVERACWEGTTFVNELGMYKVRVLQEMDDTSLASENLDAKYEEVVIRVWVVPSR